jgi:hypothetical protein
LFVAPGKRRSHLVGGMILQRSGRRAVAANSFRSDFLRHPAQLGWSSGFSLFVNKLKFELQQNEKKFSRFTQRTIRARPRRGRGPIHRIRLV